MQKHSPVGSHYHISFHSHILETVASKTAPSLLFFPVQFRTLCLEIRTWLMLVPRSHFELNFYCIHWTCVQRASKNDYFVYFVYFFFFSGAAVYNYPRDCERLLHLAVVGRHSLTLYSFVATSARTHTHTLFVRAVKSAHTTILSQNTTCAHNRKEYKIQRRRAEQYT